MPETKTFKEPVEVRRFRDNWRVDTLESEDFFHFDFADWDMEVTFTRKRGKPFKPGDRVDTFTYEDGPDRSPGTVVRVNRLMKTVGVSWDVRPDSVQEWNEDKLEHTTL